MLEHGKGILRQPVDVDRAGAARARADAALVEPDDAKASLAQRRHDRLPERRRAAEAADEARSRPSPSTCTAISAPSSRRRVVAAMAQISQLWRLFFWAILPSPSS